MDVEVFLITNGRSTFDYALKSLEEQTVKVKITVIKDMKWIDAVNECVDRCESPYFIRVDDDMFLHPQCASYMIHRISSRKKICAYYYRLWEDWQKKIAGRVKLYNRDLVRKIGGFTTNKFGKIDKTFHTTCKKKKVRISRNASIVGIHACGTWSEQQRYRKLWSKENAKVELIRPSSYLRAQKRYKKTLGEQYNLIKLLKKKNRKIRSDFSKFLEKS